MSFDGESPVKASPHESSGHVSVSPGNFRVPFCGPSSLLPPPLRPHPQATTDQLPITID